jgi:hypothetical protein
MYYSGRIMKKIDACSECRNRDGKVMELGDEKKNVPWKAPRYFPLISKLKRPIFFSRNI